MTTDREDRRAFLRMTAAGLGAATLPPGVARALELPAHRATGTLRDVEHVVILMQENRSFDHYFGTMRGVRGFGDPRPIDLPSGRPVWAQPSKDGADVRPFRFDIRTTRAETTYSLDHSWKGSHALWKRHDAWIPTKTALTMGYFTRAELPFYFALADAFTVCDAWYSSIFAQTNPNRLFLWTGTSGLSAGDDSKICVANPPEETNDFADPKLDSPKFAGLAWPTYPERLTKAKVSWRIYQEYDNFGDNGLAYFKAFRGIGPDHDHYRLARAWAPGSTPENAKASDGRHLVEQFKADVMADRLPQVSWIVPSFKNCEHPAASPSDGAWLTARLIAALAANPKVWARTVFILNYDENDGFFDHLPPPVPPAGSAVGKMTMDAQGEVYHGEPVGLGPRVPAIIISPWSKGGFVNSQVFDHTSVLRFLEARFGVEEPHISPWRRAVCGDLTSCFDFRTPSTVYPPMPDVSALPARADAARTLPFPRAPALAEPHPRQEAGDRPSRPLPYAFDVAGHMGHSANDGFTLAIENTGQAGAAFALYPAGPGEPRFYAVEAGKKVADVVPVSGDTYDFTLHGPNGFLRAFKGQAGPVRAVAAASFDAKTGRLVVTVENHGPAPITLELKPVAYRDSPPRLHRLAPGGRGTETYLLKDSANWYDLVVTCVEAPRFLRRFAGHGEDGRPSVSDPLFGQA